MYNATGGVLPMPIDPTGGTLLTALVNRPSFMERVSQAHMAGWLIIILGIIGILIVIERSVYLILIGRKIKAQLNSSKPDLNNPLGRILAVFNESKGDDAETLELRMEEAVLRERPIIEARLGFLKHHFLIGVLLGLLGTVAGVMNTFQAMNLFGGGSLVSSGIARRWCPPGWVSWWRVLLFCHGLLTSRSGMLMHILEQQSASILAARAEKLAAMKAAK